MDLHVTHMDEIRSAYKMLVGEPEGKRLLGDLRKHRWEENIKIDRKEI
jgi:hypothetical protein